MKSILTAITALLLAAITLAACAAPVELPQGTIKGNVYTNESANLKFTAPENWYMMSASQTLSSFWSDGVPLDMYAEGEGAHVMVGYEDLAAAGKTGCGEEAYFTAMKENTIKKYPDIDFEFSDYTDVNVGSNTFRAMCMSYSESGHSFNVYYYIRPEGSCMIIVSVNIPENGSIDSVMANFS